jgi:glutaredoxin
MGLRNKNRLPSKLDCARLEINAVYHYFIPWSCETLRIKKSLRVSRNARFLKRPFSKKGDPMMGENDIMMYTLTTCSHCKATKKFLSECGVKYEFTDVDLLTGEERAAILEDVKKFNPRCSFPTIVIGETVIIGFKEKEIREALGL